MTSCGDVRILLGSHVLGALEPGEAERVEQHLLTCPACREEHERLARLPALLDLVDPDRGPGEAPAPQLERIVLSEFAAGRPGRRRAPRWRVALAGALAGVAATIAVLAAAGALSPDGGDDTLVALSSPPGAPAASARARLITTSAGTEIRLDAQLPPLARGQLYELWCSWGDVRLSAGTFTVDDAGRASVRLTTAAPADVVESLGITREPDGIDPARNGPVVAVGAMPG